MLIILLLGIEIYYVVKFKPQEIREYSLDLVCSTEREKFLYPIRAIGHKSQVTFPDDISFGVNTIKCTVGKTLLLKNIGTGTVKFVMSSMHNCITCPTEVRLSCNVGYFISCIISSSYIN